MEQLQNNKERYNKPLKELVLLSKDDYARKSDEIYNSHSYEYYVYMLKRCVIFYCSNKYEDVDDTSVSYFTCDNLLRFIRENLKGRN